MKTYFIRHTEKLDIDEKTFGCLLKNKLIAIHFPYLENENEKFDTTSLNPDDYKKTPCKKAINCFVALAQEGGYVCAEYRSLEGALIGFVPPNTRIELLEGTWGDKNNLQGRKAILKTLPLSKAQLVDPSRYLVISSGRPRQGTIAVWRSAGKKIESLVENKPLEQILQNLSPTQQEVLCSEFLRSGLDANLLPKIESFLLPVGRTLIDVDIVGISNKNKKIYAQVTYSKFKHCKAKFDSLKKYASKEIQTIFFCNCPKPKIVDEVIIYPLHLVFDKFSKSDVGKKWINEIFK